ncbi:hypothetical protein DCCM_0397 [Desulfocucumis palustris]|uniref:Uncharacterized protein n=1 Tax=Desulfocucumis palustris TaxID=1898651 RepID=A0A2L2XDA1_9FIRM|nr:hypothetical protein [Desulfocucumis palustris]GBF32206.1 hypothetical protein DCCM_0397 [Desulfocucumis palustris]
MPAPLVSWYSADNVAQLTKWEIGTIDAGSISPMLGVLIWNNRGGTADVSTMTNCTITTKDSAGGDTGELVTNLWIEVKVDSMGETDFTGGKIGGPTTHVIQAGGNTTFNDVTTSPNAKEILGVANDSSKTNAKGNYAQVSLRANVPATATAGNVNFLTRVAYQYV